MCGVFIGIITERGEMLQNYKRFFSNKQKNRIVKNQQKNERENVAKGSIIGGSDTRQRNNKTNERITMRGNNIQRWVAFTHRFQTSILKRGRGSAQTDDEQRVTEGETRTGKAATI